MDEKMKGKVDKYFDLLAEIKTKVQDELAAVRILSEIARDLRMEQISKERGRNGGSDGLATSAQLRYLKRLGVQVTPGLSKQQASALIDAELEKGAAEEEETAEAVSPQQDDGEEPSRYVYRVKEKGPVRVRRVSDERVPESTVVL